MPIYSLGSKQTISRGPNLSNQRSSYHTHSTSEQTITYDAWSMEDPVNQQVHSVISKESDGYNNKNETSAKWVDSSSSHYSEDSISETQFSASCRTRTFYSYACSATPDHVCSNCGADPCTPPPSYPHFSTSVAPKSYANEGGNGSDSCYTNNYCPDSYIHATQFAANVCQFDVISSRNSEGNVSSDPMEPSLHRQPAYDPPGLPPHSAYSNTS